MEKKFTHINKNGDATMVDVNKKDVTERIAIASGEVKLSKYIIEMIKKGNILKGNVLTVAKIAGILAAKKTSELIPLCHNIPVDVIDIEFKMKKTKIIIIATVKTTAKTGVEMEALTAVSTAALTIYDMCKSINKGLEITGIKLLKKTGGKSGYYFLK